MLKPKKKGLYFINNSGVFLKLDIWKHYCQIQTGAMIKLAKNRLWQFVFILLNVYQYAEDKRKILKQEFFLLFVDSKIGYNLHLKYL